MSTLIHPFPLLLFVVLAGCYSDQRQQLAVCKMELRGKVFSANPEIQAKAETDTLELCMNARGYEVVENSCPIGHSSLGSQSDDYVETGKKDNCAGRPAADRPALLRAAELVGEALVLVGANGWDSS